MRIFIETLEGYEDVRPGVWFVDTDDGKLHGPRGVVKGSWSRSRKYPYNSVTLRDVNGKKIHKRLDRIIGTALVGGRTVEKNEIDHKDGNHGNDDPENLEWVTRKENMRRCYTLHRYKTDGRQFRWKF